MVLNKSFIAIYRCRGIGAFLAANPSSVSLNIVSMPVPSRSIQFRSSKRFAVVGAEDSSTALTQPRLWCHLPSICPISSAGAAVLMADVFRHGPGLAIFPHCGLSRGLFCLGVLGN
jgi:hypothetical protein